MEASLDHTYPDTSMIDPFNETFFKRWQERVFLAIDVVNLGHILTDSKLEDGFDLLPTWETRNKQVRHAILSTLSNELFDDHCQYKVVKEIWDELSKKIYLGRYKNSKICHREFYKFPNDWG